MKKKELIPYLIAVCALLIGAWYDYQITDALYQKQNIVAMAFERLGPLFVQMIAVVTMCMLHRYMEHKGYQFLAWILSIYMLQDLAHYFVHVSLPILGLCALGALLIVILVWKILQYLPMTVIKKRLNFFVFFTCVLATAILITFLIKNAWGRIRYRDMKDLASFCVWYRPCGLYGNHSFPSGHTTAFTAILCFLQWKDHPRQRIPWTRYVILTILIIAMPITRMMMGAHFLSDTAMGFIITYSCYLIYRQLFTRGGRI